MSEDISLSVRNDTEPRPASPRPSYNRIESWPLEIGANGTLQRSNVNKTLELHVVDPGDTDSLVDETELNADDSTMQTRNFDTPPVPGVESTSRLKAWKRWAAERWARKRTSWLVVGLALEICSFIIALTLNVYSLSNYTEYPVAEWLAPNPSLSPEQQSMRIDTILAFRSILIFHVINIWAIVYELFIYLDLYWNLDPILTIFFAVVKAGSFATSMGHYFVEMEMVDIIQSNPIFLGNNDPAFQQDLQSAASFGIWRPILSGILLVFWIPVLFKIYPTLRWSVYRKFGGNKSIARRIRHHAWYMVALKLVVLVAVNAAIIWAIFIRSPPNAESVPTEGIAGLLIAIVIALAMCFFGYLAERFQSLLAMVAFICVCVMGIILLPLAMLSSRYYMADTQGLETLRAAWSFPLWISFCVLSIFLQLIASIFACYFIWNGPWLSWRLLTVCNASDVPAALDSQSFSSQPLTTQNKLLGHWSGFTWDPMQKESTSVQHRWALETCQSIIPPTISDSPDAPDNLKL